MCGGSGGSSTPKADPVAEREAAQAEATQKANQELLTSARRKRIGNGLLASGAAIGSVMAPKAVAVKATNPDAGKINPSVWGDA